MSGCVPAGDRSTCLLVQRRVDALSASRRPIQEASFALDSRSILVSVAVPQFTKQDGMAAESVARKLLDTPAAPSARPRDCRRLARRELVRRRQSEFARPTDICERAAVACRAAHAGGRGAHGSATTRKGHHCTAELIGGHCSWGGWGEGQRECGACGGKRCKRRKR
jgi:hypothetical protein